MIFDGGIKLLEDEQEKVNDYKKHLVTEGFKFPKNDSIWNDNYIFRFLQAAKFKYSKCNDMILSHFEYRASIKRPLVASVEIEKYLVKYFLTFLKRMGMFYCQGRDHKFRPIIQVQPQIIIDQDLSPEHMVKIFSFFLQYIVENLLIPGQVENWIVLNDMKGVGITSVPVKKLKAMAKFMNIHFRGRLFRGYVINAPTAFNIVFKIISLFIDEFTLQKLKITTDSSNPDMLEHISTYQLEKRFGGILERPKVYWPPQFQNESFHLAKESADECLISEDEYMSKMSEGELEGYQIAPWAAGEEEEE